MTAVEKSTPSVLIVEDEPAVARAIAAVLREYDVRIAHDIEAAATLLLDARFDLVICDVALGSHGCDELYHSIVKMRPRIAERFVFLTGGSRSPRLASFLDETALPVWEKPFVPAEMRAAVRRRIEEVAGRGGAPTE